MLEQDNRCLEGRPWEDRAYAGLRLRSGVPLPDLPLWTGDDRPVDLVIGAGPVPDTLPDLVVRRPLLQVAADGACRFAIAGVAAWWIAPDGSRITVDMAGRDQAAMRTFLYGTVFALVVMRRGLLPLHACCVERDGQAVAICGESGAGKSTLAAQLVRRGFRLLADDVTVLDMDAGVAPLALPTFPRIKLWRDMLDRLEIDATGLEPVRAELDKYSQPETEAFCAGPRPLRRLLLLDARALDAGRSHRKLTPMESLSRMAIVVYRQQMMLRLGLAPRQMAQYLRLLSATGGCMAVRRPADARALDDLLSLLAA